MRMNKTHLIVFIVGVILGLCTGFFAAKGIYDRPVIETVTRDTVTVTDTIPHYYPQPVDGTKVKTEYRWLTKVTTDTVVKTDVKTCHDSVLVEVPIESRHYHEAEFDAWISGFEPSLDSIKVYQKETVITEVRTISKPPNRWELDALAGVDYNTATQKYTPYAGGELMYKPSRLQVGIRGGVTKQDKTEPFIGAVVKYRIL